MAERKKLIKDLTALLEGLGDEDLAFLLNQAEVLEYNRGVRERRAAAEDEAAVPEASPAGGNKEKKKKKAPPVKKAVTIEQTGNKKFFNICVGDARIFMDYHEIQALYKIARGAGNPREGAARLYRWLQKERSDVLSEGRISGPGSPVLKEIYEALLESFTAS